MTPPPPPPLQVGPLTGAANWNASFGNLLPGDTVSRLVTVKNSGQADLINYQLQTTSSTGNALTTDTTNGLHVRIDRCSVPWTFSGSGSALAATCSGTLSTVVGTSPVVGTHALGSPFCAGYHGGCAEVGSDYLRVTVDLPSSAGNSFEGLTANLTFTFSAAG